MSSNDAGMAYSAIEVEVEGDQTAVNNEVPDNIAKALPGTNSKDPPPPFFLKLELDPVLLPCEDLLQIESLAFRWLHFMY